VSDGPHPLLSAALRGPAWVYGKAVARRNRRYGRPGAVTRAELPVISVGNLTVGGTGKTPIVAWIARRLSAAGRRPAIVSRGYGGNAGRGPLVVAGSTGGPRVEAARCGDEPWLLARTLAGTIVVVGADRVAGAAEARRIGAELILLDDGFQHRRLARDLDVVLLDAVRPFGNGRLLPAGSLREPPDSLGRADVVVLTRAVPGERHEESCRRIARHAPGTPLLRSTHRATGFVDADGAAMPTPDRVVAFCGIARPASFRASLDALGVAVAAFEPFRDHHPYTVAELGRLRRRAEAEGAVLVTTEKDMARLIALPDGAHAVAAVRIEVEFDDDTPLWRAVADLAKVPR